jgi:AcrR family transcriptional regulator
VPHGGVEVRRAVLDAAGRLFADQGVDAVSLRDIAAEANIQLALISRYIGSRESLIVAVFDDLSEQLANEILERPLQRHGFEPGTLMIRWTRVAASMVSSGWDLGRNDFNPVLAIARTAQDAYGIDERSARIRAAQIVGSTLGWRLFESYLVESGELTDESLEDLRDEVNAIHRLIGTVAYPADRNPQP